MNSCQKRDFLFATILCSAYFVCTILTTEARAQQRTFHITEAAGPTHIKAAVTVDPSTGHFQISWQSNPYHSLEKAYMMTAVRPNRFDRQPPMDTDVQRDLTTHTDRGFWYERDFESDRLDSMGLKAQQNQSGDFEIKVDANDLDSLILLTHKEFDNASLKEFFSFRIVKPLMSEAAVKIRIQTLIGQSEDLEVKKLLESWQGPDFDFAQNALINRDKEAFAREQPQVATNYTDPIKSHVLIVNHAEPEFDDMTAKPAIDLLLQEFKQQDQPIIVLSSRWKGDVSTYIDRTMPTAFVYSYGGEHNLRILTDEVTLVGGFFGNSEGAQGCLTMALADTINRSFYYRKQNETDAHKLMVHLPMDAIYYYSNESWNNSNLWVHQNVQPLIPELPLGGEEGWDWTKPYAAIKDFYKALLEAKAYDMFWRSMVLSSFYQYEPDEPIGEITAYGLLTPDNATPEGIRSPMDLDNVKEWRISSEEIAGVVSTKDGYQFDLFYRGQHIKTFKSATVPPDKLVTLSLE